MQKIREFVLAAGRATYASGDQSIKEVQSDKSTTIEYKNDEFPDLSFHDNYFGGEPYGGREVVFKDGEPVWMMVYYGWVEKEQQPDIVYEILMGALRNSSIEMPYRGPELFEKDGWRYQNKVDGDFENFNGIEKIFNSSGQLVYQARYMGGIVDQ